MNPSLAPGETIEFKFTKEELTPSSYTPTKNGIQMEIYEESYLHYINYMPVTTNVLLNSDVIDISCGWYYININL